MSEELKIAIEAARKASEQALSFYEKKIEVSKKADGSLVTNVDQKNEKLIKEIISSKFADASFVAEEANEHRDKDTYWAIDPIDGTRNYVHHEPFWCVLIAFFRDNIPVIGVCSFPLLGGLMYAERGSGAFLGEKRLKVSSVDNLSKAYLGYGSLKRFNEKEKQGLIGLVEKVGSSRAPAPTYSLFQVAQGNVDICVDAYAELWDRAPFQTIIPEAGGIIRNQKGEELTKYDRGYVASNALLQEEVVRIYNQ